jgi:hypothetical protein
MEVLVESLLECGFFISPSKFKIKAYLEDQLELLLAPYWPILASWAL